MATKKTFAEAHDSTHAPAAERGPTTEERFAAFSARYKWYFFAPVLVLIAVVIVIAVVSGQRTTMLEASVEAGRTARTLEELDEVARQYAGTFAGDRALVCAGDLLYDEGRYAEARGRYQAYLERDPDPALGMLARATIVQTYLDEHDYAGAIEACDDAFGRHERESIENQLSYYKAYAYEMSGDAQKATQEYAKITQVESGRAGANTAWSRPARKRLIDIGRTPAPTGRPPAPARKKPEKDVDTPGEG